MQEVPFLAPNELGMVSCVEGYSTVTQKVILG